MEKNIKRWYEKNEYVKAFLSLLQDLPIEEQCEIAVDMILDASSLLERDYSKVIQEVSIFNPKDLKRWYDVNPNIHTAIEVLRDLKEEQRVEIVQKFSERILKFHTINTDELESPEAELGNIHE